MPGPSPLLKRDENGRIVQRTLNIGGKAETWRYAYDSAGRLARVADGYGALLESYQYDHEGRRLADINPQRFNGERRYSYSPCDRLLQAGLAQYGHDASGFRNLKVEGGRETRYHYEPSGLLMAVELPGGRRIDYAYDAKGQRTEKRLDGRVVEAYRWMNPLRLLEFHDGCEWWRLAYDSERPSRTPIGVTNGDDSYLIYSDHLGTPLGLADLDRNVVQTMRYDAFGNSLRGLQGGVPLPIGFAGGLFDPETGLTRFPWRDYDADTGRFTALDPMGTKGGDTDWYGYCVDDPVNRVDVWGLWSLFGIEFSGDGRPAWQPKYGNWGGQDWSGGQNPKRHDGQDGDAAPVDSSDTAYKRHDEAWGRCESEDILSSHPDKWRKDCKKDADKVLVDDLKRLPDDPKGWKSPPPLGQDGVAKGFQRMAEWWFSI